jgi:hypothetical protein
VKQNKKGKIYFVIYIAGFFFKFFFCFEVFAKQKKKKESRNNYWRQILAIFWFLQELAGWGGRFLMVLKNIAGWLGR